MDFYGNYVGRISGEIEKHCPFCGAGEQKIYETGFDCGGEGCFYRYKIVCTCGITMEGKALADIPGVPKMVRIQNVAKSAWNRRVVL